MVNTYGYNRKTLEEDEAVMAAVRRHHNAVANKGYLVVMTSLVGSQNYDLDHEGSDVDTFSLVFPPLNDLAQAKEPYAGMFEFEGGHCEVKDMRLALNLLKKTSPNSVEYFTSKYKVYNPLFEDVLKEYLDDNAKLWHMVHCNYEHMLYAMAGMAHQLTKRNMPAGKRFAHALRLELRMGGDRELALAAKLNADEEKDLEYDEQTEQLAARMDRYKEAFVKDKTVELVEEKGMALVNSFQWKLFKKYLMETNK